MIKNGKDGVKKPFEEPYRKRNGNAGLGDVMLDFPQHKAINLIQRQKYVSIFHFKSQK